MKHYLPIVAVAAFLPASALAQPKALPLAEFRANGDITFGNALRIGKRESSKTVITPATLKISGTGSTGDVFDTSARAVGVSLTPRSLAERWADTTRTKDFGAICDGGSHPLSQRYSSLTAARMLYPEAQALSDEIDWAATQRAMNARASSGSGLIEAPGGACQINRPLVMPETGSGFTRLRFTGQGTGTVFQPTASLSAMLSIPVGNVTVSGILFTNRDGLAGVGIAINKPWNNIPITVRDNQFIGFGTGITYQGDNVDIEGNFFNSNGTAISMVRCLNSRIRSNYVLGGNGIDFPVPNLTGGEKQCEGIKITDNDTLPAKNGSFSLRIRAGLMIDVTNHMADQILESHGIIIDGTAAPVRSVTIKGGWIGSPVSTLAKYDGLHVETASHVMVSALTIDGFSGYDVGATNAGFLGLFDIVAHTTAGLGSVKLSNAPAARIIGGTYHNTKASVIEDGTTYTRALGANFYGPVTKADASQYLLNAGDPSPDLVLGNERGTDAVKVSGGNGGVGIAPDGKSSNVSMSIVSKGNQPVRLVSGGVAALETYGSVVAARVPVLLPSYTVSELPPCAAYTGSVAMVTDFSGTPTYNGPLTGGGTRRVLVFCNGDAWTAH
ncbi:hypothetical protein H0176_20430 [Methylorubrum populi]|jgi:hypothetical protein|uniref:hypothetical protein n=1 Tax=Methylorubrum rhodesianum TaxID=29427 RepID=UPI0019092979|nr:hypothetical protein [Methylorubrum rhodesianum]MBK3406174.1 hypothetical protein [Methylorubrum rhodesianum]MBY0142626.1 hypothetical protein [Methylorubrum populi]